MRNILFIGAHPDDIEIGCGGTVIEHIKNSDNVFALVVTDGEQGVKKNTKGYKRYNRLEETTEALKSTGIKDSNLIFLHLSDTMLWKARHLLLGSLEKTFEKFCFDRVYTHTEKSYHQDHVTVNQETLRSLRNNAKIDILTYETNGSTKPEFIPNYFVEIGDVIEKKINALKYHESQSDKFTNNSELIITLAKFRAHQAKIVSYSEAFEVKRINWKGNNSNI
jgi:LmbE family N-acetylglucosaminyl deacetylase